MTDREKEVKKIARIEDGALVGCDFHYYKWEDTEVVFTVEDFGHPDRKRLVASGYGSKAEYGNGAIYVKESDLIYADSPLFEPKPDEGMLLSPQELDDIIQEQASWAAHIWYEDGTKPREDVVLKQTAKAIRDAQLTHCEPQIRAKVLKEVGEYPCGYNHEHTYWMIPSSIWESLKKGEMP